jgi:hypothetical protein
MKLVSIPVEKSDNIVLEIVATYLNHKEIVDINAFPVAVNLLAALEMYRQTHDLGKLVLDLDIDDIPMNQVVNGHSIKCHVNYSKFQQRVFEWKNKYPNFCSLCKGASGFTDYNYPHSPDGFDLCDCVDHINEDTVPHCPRCGKNWPVEMIVIEDFELPYMRCEITEKELPCPDCGYSWCKNNDDMMEEWPGCICEGTL